MVANREKPMAANSGNPLQLTKPTPTGTPPTSPPTSPHSPTYYLSPQSPTPLHFPPSSKFGEWKGRCFRCCRTGYSIATCRNPPKCGQCWKNGHTGNRCKAATTRQAPMPAGKSVLVNRFEGNEPRFNDMLTEPKPLGPPPMQEDRPQVVQCFVDRDAEFYQELDRLNNAVVVHATDLDINFELSVDKMVEWVVKMNLIPENEIVIAALTKRRFLIILPEGLAHEVLIEAIPYEVWDERLSFQKWDPLEDAEAIVPEFKTVVDITGIPPHLYREKEVIKAVSNFGLYLGTVAQANQANLSAWTVVVATEKLEDIPLSVSMVAGPLKYPIQIIPVIWKKGEVFRQEDYPQPLKKFTKPLKSMQDDLECITRLGVESSVELEDDDLFPMSRQVLLEICKGRALHELPLEIRAVITEEDLTGLATQILVTQSTTPDPSTLSNDEAGRSLLQTLSFHQRA